MVCPRAHCPEPVVSRVRVCKQRLLGVRFRG